MVNVVLKRNEAIDVLKGIGIILVIIGHMNTSQIGGGIITYIYSFHMALFFWCTGYLSFNSKSNNQNFFKFFIKKFKKIIIPYILFFCISLLYGHFIVRNIFDQYVIPFNLKDSLKALVYSSEWLNTVPTFNFALWFLPTLFITTIIFYFITKIKKPYLFALVILLLSFVTIPLQQRVFIGRPILSLNAIPGALVFMGIGYLFRQYESKIKLSKIVLLALFCFSLWGSYAYQGNIQSIGHYIYFAIAIACILVFYYISKDLSSSNILKFIGKNSLIYLGLHSLISYSYQFTKIQDYFIGQWNGIMTFAINLLYIIILSGIIILLKEKIVFCLNYVFKLLYNKLFKKRKKLET